MADLMQDGPQRNRVRYILALALMVGILLAGYLAFNVWDRVRALGSAQQDHAEWVFSQLEIDFLKLDGAVEQARSGAEMIWRTCANGSTSSTAAPKSPNAYSKAAT